MLDLVLNVGMEEVKKALFEMKPWKAPGLDSFHVGFIQNKWSLVGRDICVDVNNVLQGGDLCGHVNNTLISLIPKVPLPNTLNSLDPLLCIL